MNPQDLIVAILGPVAAVVVPLIMLVFPPPANVRVCPDGLDLRTGIRPDGRYACWPHPTAPTGWDAQKMGRIEEWDGTFQRPERSVQVGQIVEGRIWCPLGSRAVVVDYRTAGCRRW